MDQSDAEAQLGWRLYQWARETIAREVAHHFPALRLCQHERRIACFLAWMHDIPESQRLPICLSLVKNSNRPAIGKRESFTSFDEEAPDLADIAYSRFHETLPPTPDSDRSSPDFIKGDLKRCRDLIVEALEGTWGKPTQLFPEVLWYIHHHGDWTHKCVVELRSAYGSGLVQCQHFLWRSDFRFVTKPDDLIRSINVLAKLGIGIWGFPLIGKTHEQMSAQAVTTVMNLFTQAVPTLVADLVKCE